MKKAAPLYQLINVCICAALTIPGPMNGRIPGKLQAAPREAEQRSNLGDMIGADGSLQLDGHFSGPLDLEGWDVQLDPARGPVFSPSEKPAAAAGVLAGHWESMGSGSGALNDEVYAVAVSGTKVYFGGRFKNAAEIPGANYIVVWNGTDWYALGGAGALNSSVYAIAVAGSDVYVGGAFTNARNNGVSIDAADYVAKWNGAQWSALGNNGETGGSLNGWVYSLAVDGADLYVGGWFTDVQNGISGLAEADYVARWDGSKWYALGSDGAGGGALSSAVFSIAASGGDVYVGGNFVNAGGLAQADYVAFWNGANWAALGSDGAGNGAIKARVTALGLGASGLYVGGHFQNAAGLVAADYLARWDGAAWSRVGGSSFQNALNGPVEAILVNGTDVYVGGDFVNVYDLTAGKQLKAADYIARWNGSSWSGLGEGEDGDGALNNEVLALAFDGTRLYAGGRFGPVNNEGSQISHAQFVSAFDGADWSALGEINGALNAEVYALSLSGNDLYVGGNFINAGGGAQTDHIVHWDGVQGSALGDDGEGNGVIPGQVIAIAVDGTDVYVGGSFENILSGGVTIPEADYIAKWDGTAWSALGSNGSGNGALTDGIRSLAAGGGSVYVGGYFENAAGIPEADYIARWDGANWHALGDNGAGDGSLNWYINAIALSGSNVYAAGAFTNINNNGMTIPEADYVARWDGSNWSALGGNGSGDGAFSSSQINALAASGADLYVGGFFYNVAGIPEADYIARWNGSNWSAMGNDGSGGSAITSWVNALAIEEGDVYAGGAFLNAGGVPEADYIARWDGTGWSALGSDGAGDGSIDDQVWALAVSDTAVYAGGDFYNVNNNGTVLPYADHIANFQIQSEAIDVTIAGVDQDSYLIDPTSTVSDSYPAILDGPVNVFNDSLVSFFTSQRVTSGASYNELMGVPPSQFTTEYWFPWYDHGYPSVGGSSMRTWILVGNPDDALTADVDIYIGGTLMNSYSIPPGDNITPRWTGLQDGPVRVVSDIPVFASERVFTVPNNSFNEVMGYPADQFTTEYWFPWYDSVSMNASILVGNTSSSLTADVDIFIGPNFMGNYDILPNDTLIQSYPATVNGPVRVVATNGVDIVASEAALSGPTGSFTAYNEVMGYPSDQFATEYHFPWYDHGYPSVGGSNMRTWILVGNPDDTLTADVDIFIDGALQGSYSIPPNSRITPRWIGLQAGPVRVVSDIPVFTSERVFTSPSNVFNEMMGYPSTGLTFEYWFAWYDSINMSSTLLIARP